MTGQPMEVLELCPRISVIGVGGAGGNAIANMIRHNARGIDFVVANTDSQALRRSEADWRIQLGAKTTNGLGAGANAAIGRAAAEESIANIEKALEGKHICFIAAGLGGGTGTGAAPVIAKAARDRGILTVGIVTKPFDFEGARRARIAEAGLGELEQNVDTLIVIPNQNLFRVTSADTTFKAAFELADEVLHQGVQSLTDLMISPGHVNLDFADIRAIMLNMGRALIGTGTASGDNRAVRAAQAAMSNPLLDDAMNGAQGLIISISGGDDLRLMEVDEAASHIADHAHPDAEIIWGSTFRADLTGMVRVSVVATGIQSQSHIARESPALVTPTLSTLLEQPARAETAPQMVLALPLASEPPIIAEEQPIVLAAPAEPLRDEREEDADDLAPVLPDVLFQQPHPAEVSPLAAIGRFSARNPADRPKVVRIDRRLRSPPSLFERMVTAAREKIAHA